MIATVPLRVGQLKVQSRTRNETHAKCMQGAGVDSRVTRKHHDVSTGGAGKSSTATSGSRIRRLDMYSVWAHGTTSIARMTP